MNNLQEKSFATVVVLGIALLLTFQNCGPAKLNSDGVASPSAPSDSNSTSSTVGNKVDITQLMSAPQEATDNVVFPAPGAVRNSTYAIGNAITENVVLTKSDFTRIEWIQVNSATVLSNSELFSPRAFSADLAGDLLVVGYRGTSPYLIGKFRLLSRSGGSVNATSANAVIVNQRLIATDDTNELYEVDIEAPNVDVTTIRFVLSPLGTVLNGRRSLLITKAKSQSTDLMISVTDSQSQTFSRTLNFPVFSPTIHIRTRVNKSSVVDAPTPDLGTRVHLWSSAGDWPNQNFQFTGKGEIRVHGACLVASGNTAGSGIVLATCSGAANQVWSYNATTGLFKASNGLCMDVANSVMTDGTAISVWTCSGDPNQQWDLVP